MAHWLRALVILTENLNSVLKTHVSAHICYSSSRGYDPYSGPSGDQVCMKGVYICVDIHEIKICICCGILF